MIEDQTNVFWALFLALIAALCLAGSYYGEQLPEFWRVVLAIFGSVAAFVAAFLALAWVMDYVVPRIGFAIESIRYAVANTRPEVVLVEKLSRLTAEQLKMMTTYIPVVSSIGGEAGPVHFFRCGTLGEVPWEFMTAFVQGTTRSGSRHFLPAVRTWNDGTHEREWADTLTAHFTMAGLAVGAVGNHPAEWRDYHAALRWVGIDG